MNKVEGFVKSTGRDKHWDVLEKEMKTLLDTATGKIRSEYLIETCCPVCLSESYKLSFEKDGFCFVKCEGCGLLYVNPQLNEEKIISNYEGSPSSDSWVDVLISREEQEWNIENKLGPVLNDINAMYPERGNILDIGCSIGLFLKLAKEAGWSEYGLEIHKKAVDYAVNNLGLNVESKLLHEADYHEGFFKVISMWGVLEHLTDPRLILKQSYELLDDNGLLIIFVPNGHSLVARTLRGNCSTFNGKNHLWYFGPETLTKLLVELGYHVTKAYTIIAQTDEIKNYLDYSNPYEHAQNDMEKFQFDELQTKALEDYILSNQMGSKLIVYVRKSNED